MKYSNVVNIKSVAVPYFLIGCNDTNKRLQARPQGKPDSDFTHQQLEFFVLQNRLSIHHIGRSLPNNDKRRFEYSANQLLAFIALNCVADKTYINITRRETIPKDTMLYHNVNVLIPFGSGTSNLYGNMEEEPLYNSENNMYIFSKLSLN